MNATPAGWYPDPEHPAMLRWYDGAAWTEHRAPATPPRRPRNTAKVVVISVGVAVGALMLLGVAAAVVIPVILNQQHRGAVDDIRSMTCQDVAAEAVATSQDSVRAGEVPLTSTTEMVLVADERDALSLPEDGETFVMRCSGRGTWADGVTTPLVVEMYTDHDGEHLYTWEWE